MKPIHQDQLIAYALGDLSEAEAQEMAALIRQSPDLQAELAELQLVLGELDKAPKMEPSPESRDQFYQFLALEARQQDEKTGSQSTLAVWRAAAAVALLVIGTAFGLFYTSYQQQQAQIGQLSAQVVETRKLLLLAMMEDASASERIKAMNVSTRDFEEDQRIVAALIDRLQRDVNENVRLKAAESLADFVLVRGVTEAMIESLETESSPEVQIMLIESLVNGQRREALPSLQRMLDREDVPKVVRDLAAHGVETMI